MEILQHMANKRFRAVDIHISPEDLRSGYKKWKEKTSTSPSGLHLGHYKTLAHAKPEKNDDGSEKYGLDAQMFEIEASRANIAVQYGFVFERWETIVNLMLEKIKGNPRMDKLRVIHIFEADLNLLLGIIWNRRLIQHGEKHKAYGEEQWGSRPGRSCEEVLLMKQLTYSLMELTRTPGGTFDNDAKACFDRIVMILAALRGQQLGLPEEATVLLTHYFERAKYFITTMIGRAREGYTSTEDNPLHGPGQGGRASPGIWM
jgi:hypothetical protein